jgi:hypothetical protein
LFIVAKTASILLHLSKINYDTGQTSHLFYKGKEYLLSEFKSIQKVKNLSNPSLIIELTEGEIKEGIYHESAGIMLDFAGYMEFIAINPVFENLIFLQIKKKTELQIWRNELISNSKIIPVISELRTDWLKCVFIERLPVLFEVSSKIEFPAFIPGYVFRPSKNKELKGIDSLRHALRENQLAFIQLIKQRRELVSLISDLKKENDLPVFQEDIFLRNVFICYEDANLNEIPLNDCIDLYMMVHEMAIKQQEELRK